MALRRRFLPVFKKHAPRGKPRFAKPLQGHFGPAAKHSQKHKNRPKIGRFSHFNPSAEMHPFSLFSASKAPQKWLCDAICRKKQLFAGSFGSRSHSFCSFTAGNTGLTKKDVGIVINTFIVTVTKALVEGSKVQLLGFGVFGTRERNARKVRNPRTGESIDLAASTVPYFKPGKILRDVVKSINHPI